MRLTRRGLHVTSAVMLGVALPVLVWGLDRSRAVWLGGLGLVAVGLATAFATRFASEGAS